ncbi:MAG: oxidoreductase [Nanoarchaeota archaeon]|nr:oxidoreductase [Nanoarchaeota archaeon]|tara:strand:+ start:751 stop:1569 length:819 start_codon:yes stop_codon:yes gene_type:complete
MKTIKLASGHEMPVFGLGTWQLTGDKCKEAVKKAIELGYNHIDTAWIYGNQEEIGEALKEANVDRSKLFITSKVWKDNLDYKGVLSQCKETLDQLQLDYLDLYLIHWPNPSMDLEETFRAFNELVEEGKVKSVGVSNFNSALTKEAQELSEVPVSVNQVEFHPYLNQKNLLKFCKKNNVVVTSYSPLARGKILQDNVLKNIADENNKTISQVALRWMLQKDMIVIPKASSEDHIKENMDVFDWKLSDENMEKIDDISEKHRVVDVGGVDFDD